VTTGAPNGEWLDEALAEAWRALALSTLDLRSRWTQVAADVGLSPAGLDALLKVDPDAAPSMRRLAEQLGCDASYVTVMVDDLERAGYAQRRPSDTDRRVKNVALTDAGRRARALALARLTAPPAQLQALPPARQRVLADLLRQALDRSGLPARPSSRSTG
jgi:DNA-binding MarR family transcriptional regulator